MPLDLNISGIESAKLKLARVAVHLDEIRHLISESTKKAETYEIIKDTDGKDKVNFLVGAPRDVLVIVGEIIYHFKSALDHLAFQLVQSNLTKQPLPQRWDRDCQFPLMVDVPTYGNPKVPYPIPVPQSVFEKSLPCIPAPAYELIESVQPYHRGPGIHNVLRIVAKLANIDKHKHFHVIIPKLAIHHHATYSSGYTGVSTIGGLQQGAEVPLFPEIEGDPTENVYRTFSPYVTFDTETVGEGPDTLESQNVLEVVLQQFETVIIPTFEHLLQYP